MMKKALFWNVEVKVANPHDVDRDDDNDVDDEDGTY